MLLLQQELFYMNMLDKKLQNKTFNENNILYMNLNGIKVYDVSEEL